MCVLVCACPHKHLGKSSGSRVATKKYLPFMGSSLGKNSNARSVQKKRIDYVEYTLHMQRRKRIYRLFTFSLFQSKSQSILYLVWSG